MLRQRLRIRSSPLVYVGRTLLVLVSLAFIWYGLMLVLLALKVSPDSIDSISGYRSAYDYLAGLIARDVTGQTRVIAGLGGLAAFLLFGYLALKELPRPYLARGGLRLSGDERGVVDIEPRAIERVAEVTAAGQTGVSSARARYGIDELALDVSVRRARELPETLRETQRRVRAALAEHGLPPMPIDVTLTGFDRKQRRELS